MLDLVSSALMPAAGFALRTAYRNATEGEGQTGLTLDPSFGIELGDESHKLNVSLEQLSQIGVFLEAPTVRSLTRMAVIYYVLNPAASADSLPTSYSNISVAFTAFANDWCERKSEAWRDAAPLLWQEITRRLESIGGTLRRHLGPVGAGALAESFHLDKLSTSVAAHEQALIDIAEGKLQVADLARKIDKFREVVQETAGDTFDVQGGEFTATFDSLYIERTLADARTKVVRSTSEVLGYEHHSPRAVVIGDPGAGKSTLMKWLEWRLALGAQHGAPIPLTLVCRTDLSSGQASVIDACRRQAESRLGELLDSSEFNAMLALGVFAVMVDGVDEIADRDRRTAVVRHVEVLERNYPFLMVICSTRRLGFEVPQFTRSRFDVYSLEDYDEAQVSEYAHKWFSTQEVRAERFLGESRHLLDLRSNPLMLALLCGLYNQQDYIPQSRRDVYIRCAALMFHEWDPKRGIRVPQIFKTRGDRILYEIARLLDQRGGFGETVSRRELERVVREFLEQAGVSVTEAVASTREFVDHCSTRAWILSATGQGSDMDREYAFTHRTFFEYFASEASVRALNRAAITGAKAIQVDSFNINPLTRAIIRPFWRDATSVMPELTLQAAQDQMGEVSHMVLQDLITMATVSDRSRAGDYVALAVRLLAAAGAGPEMAQRVLAVVAESWKAASWRDASNLRLESFRSVLDIASGHRERFLAAVRADEELAAEYLIRFAVLEMSGEVGMYDSKWASFADELLESERHRPSAATIWLSVRRGRMRAVDGILATSGLDLLQVSLDSISASGVFWEWLRHGAESEFQRENVYNYVLESLEAGFWADVDYGDRGSLGVRWIDRMVPSSLDIAVSDDARKLPIGLCLWLIVRSQVPNYALLADVSREGGCAVAIGKRLHRMMRERRFVLPDESGLSEEGRREWRSIAREYRQVTGTRIPRWIKLAVGG